MKAVAIFKWAPNPDDALVRVDGTVNWSTARHDVGDDDHAAMACAMAAADGDEVVGLCVGGGDTSFAAARGAERTVVLEGFPVPTDSMTMARALAEEIKGIEGVGLVAMGDADWDPMVAPLVAALLGWPLLTAVDGVAVADGGLVVTRRHGMGTQDIAVTGRRGGPSRGGGEARYAPGARRSQEAVGHQDRGGRALVFLFSWHALARGGLVAPVRWIRSCRCRGAAGQRS